MSKKPRDIKTPFAKLGGGAAAEELNQEEKDKELVLNLTEDLFVNDFSERTIEQMLSRAKFVDTHKQRGLYVRNDLDAILDKYGKIGGHGMKTHLVNVALKRLFEQENMTADDKPR